MRVTWKASSSATHCCRSSTNKFLFQESTSAQRTVRYSWDFARRPEAKWMSLLHFLILFTAVCSHILGDWRLLSGDFFGSRVRLTILVLKALLSTARASD